MPRSCSALVLAFSVLAGCHSPQLSADEDFGDSEGADTTDTADAQPWPLPAPTAAAVQWQFVSRLNVDDFGAAGHARIEVPPAQRFVAVRVVPDHTPPAAEQRACHRITTVSPGPAGPQDSFEFVPGPAAGHVLLPEIGAGTAVDLRVDLIDCGLGIAASRARFEAMPDALNVQVAWEANATDAKATLGVRVLIAANSGWGTRASDATIAQAWDVATERFADIGVTLEIQAEIVGPQLDTIEFSDDMLGMAELDAMAREHLIGDIDDTRFVPVAFVPCLEYASPTAAERMRPAGQTSRIPGSFADARTPSLVTISAGGCGGDQGSAAPDPERLGLVIAHELGHYLGLRHADRTGAAPDEQQLMHSTIATGVDTDDAWFSADQAELIGRHPDVVFVP